MPPTSDFKSAAGWQKAMAEDLIAGHGSIVADFVDQFGTASSTVPAHVSHSLAR